MARSSSGTSRCGSTCSLAVAEDRSAPSGAPRHLPREGGGTLSPLGSLAAGGDGPDLLDPAVAHADQLVGEVDAGAHVGGVEGHLLPHLQAGALTDPAHAVLLRDPLQ